MMFPNPKVVSFRKKVNGIKSTTYLTHSLYYYPAKFIPQIVRYCLDEYCKKGGVVLDPFAGSGTMGVEASTQGHESYMIDINPLLDYFYPLKMPSFTKEEWEKYYYEAKFFMEEVLTREPKTINKINDNIDYWYPEKLYKYFCRVWTNFHELKNQKSTIAKNSVALSLFKISKYFSYAEHSMPKLFISKRKRALIEKKLNENSLFSQIETKAFGALRDVKKSVDSVIELDGKLKKAKYFAGVDSSEFNFEKLPELDCIITSPPYLQAQEYMRTFKLEMMWVGIPQEKIKEYISKEIPFRKAPSKIQGIYINEIREKIERKDLLKLYDSYFWFTIKALENASKRLRKNGKLCVLIGNPKMNGIEVEIWKVIYEYFINDLGFNFLEVYEDKIISRKLFKGRKNQNPEGMKSEYLIVLEKP
ncbi:MAG: DNA methyltransferase [Atribacterota bacterium]|nr:DNA methyltransferase [Atribacterota bacterium]